MKLISWNVNGFRSVLSKGFGDFFDAADADVFSIQETKMQPGQAEFERAGYTSFWSSAEKKGYSGTAIFTRVEPENVTYGIHGKYNDEGRIITLEFRDFFLINSYTPNAQRELTRLDYRMIFEDDLRAYMTELDQTKPVVLCGDLNVAHEEIDLKNAKSNIGNAGFTYEERGKMTELLAAGFTDTYRSRNPEKSMVVVHVQIPRAQHRMAHRLLHRLQPLQRPHHGRDDLPGSHGKRSLPGGAGGCIAKSGRELFISEE